MKDAYSFHLDQASLDNTYQQMNDVYQDLFSRLGLNARSVEAASGEIGGSCSREFHVLAESGEDGIAYCDSDGFAMNVEMAPAPPPEQTRAEPTVAMTSVETPDVRSIESICAFLQVQPKQCIKTLLIEGDTDDLVAIVLRGDHELNALKAEQLDGVKAPLTMASAEQIHKALGVQPGSVGPVKLDLKIYADNSAAACADFVCGANTEGQHLTGVNWGRDADEPETADLRNVVAGDPSPAGGGAIAIARGIEVGHIFQLGNKYSQSMNAAVLDQSGKETPMLMGCYGIGISRIVAAAVEQSHDEQGIIWPEPIAPFQVALLALTSKNAGAVDEAAQALYLDLSRLTGGEVLLDDRDARPGSKFADADLLGIPHRLVLGERGLGKGVVEYRNRRTGDTQEVPIDGIADFLNSQLDRTAS